MDTTSPDEMLSALGEVDPAEAPDLADEIAGVLESELGNNEEPDEEES